MAIYVDRYKASFRSTPLEILHRIAREHRYGLPTILHLDMPQQRVKINDLIVTSAELCCLIAVGEFVSSGPRFSQLIIVKLRQAGLVVGATLVLMVKPTPGTRSEMK